MKETPLTPPPPSPREAALDRIEASIRSAGIEVLRTSEHQISNDPKSHYRVIAFAMPLNDDGSPLWRVSRSVGWTKRPSYITIHPSTVVLAFARAKLEEGQRNFQLADSKARERARTAAQKSALANVNLPSEDTIYRYEQGENYGQVWADLDFHTDALRSYKATFNGELDERQIALFRNFLEAL